jgi:tetratricopeptide (TPR) repeat protein
MQKVHAIKIHIGLMIILMMSPFFSLAQSALEVQADTLVAREDFAGALVLYNKILDKSQPKTEEEYQLYYKRAVCYYSLEKFSEALSDVNTVIENYPKPQAKLLRAYINQALEDYEAQLTDLNELISLNPDSPEMIQWRASVLMESGKYKEAQQDIHWLLQFQQSPQLKAYLGLTYYYLDDPDSALMMFDEIILEEPGFTPSYVYAASLSLDEGAYKLALSYIDKGLQKEPDNSTLLFYRGIALVETDKTKEGCRCLTQAFNAGNDDVAEYLKEYCYK